MRQKSITLAAGIVALGCLTGAYFLIKNYNIKTEEAANEAASGETILEIDTEDLTSVSFSINGTEQTFVKDGDQWALEGDDTFPVDSSALFSSLSGLSPLKAVRTLTNISDISEYGLDNPQNIITLQSSGGTETVITIGDTNENTSDDYLMLDEDTTTVYTAEDALLSALSSDLYDYALSDNLPTLLANKISGIRISGSDNDYELAKTEDTWMIADADGVSSEADETQVTTLLSQLATLYYVDYLEHNCTDLSAYGLDDPAAILTVSYRNVIAASQEDETEEASQTETQETEADTQQESEAADETLTFSIGAADASGNYYVQLEGSSQVHTLASSLVEALLDCSADDLRETEAETETEAESESIGTE